MFDNLCTKRQDCIEKGKKTLFHLHSVKKLHGELWEQQGDRIPNPE